MSELKINNQNGTTTTFTFKFDNGLTTKPMVSPEYKTMFSESENTHILFINLKNKEIEELQNLNIDGYFYEEKNGVGEIWLFINDKYLVMENLDAKIIEEFENKRLGFAFFREDGSLIKSIKIK
jgi:hypothetical protein